MFLAFIQVFSVILLAAFLGIFILIIIALIRTIIIKNSNIRVLAKNSLSSEKIDDYKRNMEYLFSNPLAYAIPYLFPNIYGKGKMINFEKGILFQYNKDDILPKILINLPIKNLLPGEIKFSGQNVFGENTYNSKSQLYSLFDALETISLGGEELNVNLSIAIYQKGQKNNEVFDYLKDSQETFDIVLGEGGKILDPITTGFRSFYAFIGVGVNEKVTIRYKTKKIGKGYDRLTDFIDEIKDEVLFETKIDPEAIVSIRKISKDMLYGNRFILNNIAWLPKLGKRIVEEELLESNKAWKTSFNCGEILNNEDYYFVDVDFFVSSSESEKDIINTFNKKVIKYSLEYEIIDKEEKNRGINSHNIIYKEIANLIENTFQELYVTSYILNENVDDREIEKNGKNIIRFSPLYYSRDAIIGERTNNEWVSLSSIDKAINFYEEFLLKFRRK